MFGMKHSLCFTSIVSNAQPSLSMPMKNSCVFRKSRRTDWELVGTVLIKRISDLLDRSIRVRSERAASLEGEFRISAGSGDTTSRGLPPQNSGHCLRCPGAGLGTSECVALPARAESRDQPRKLV